MKSCFALWGMVLILLVGGRLLSHQIADLALWGDEGWSNEASQQASPAAVIQFVEPDIHPPLYFLTLHLWRQFAGDDIAALRWMSVLAALITAALCYRLGAGLFNPYAGCAGALIFLTSDLVLSLSLEIRHYPFYMLWVMLSCTAYWRFARGWSWRWGVVYALSGAAMLYSLYWGVFILLAHGLHSLIFHPRRLPAMLGVAALITLLYLPWLPAFTRQMTGEGNGIEDAGYNQALPADLEGVEIILYQLFGVPEALFMGLAVAGLLVALNHRPSLDERTAFLGLWLFLPPLLGFASDGLGYNILSHRPMLALAPAMGLLCGHLISQMPPRFAALLVGIILINNLTTTGGEPMPRGQWVEVADVLATLSSPADVVQIESNTLEAFALEDHIQLRDVPHQEINLGGDLLTIWPPDADNTLEHQLEGVGSLWLVEFQRHRDIRPYLSEHGFLPLTPPIDMGYYLADNITLTYYGQPLDTPPRWSFGERLGLQAVSHFQQEGYLQVNLRWLALSAPENSYTVSVFLLNEGGIIPVNGAGQPVQHDSFPLDGRSPTAGWQAGLPYFDRHTLDIAGLPAGTYQLGVKVYQWWDGAILPIAPCETTPCDFVLVDTVTISGSNPR